MTADTPPPVARDLVWETPALAYWTDSLDRYEIREEHSNSPNLEAFLTRTTWWAWRNRFFMRVSEMRREPSLDAAKSAAQADYDARVRAALLPEVLEAVAEVARRRDALPSLLHQAAQDDHAEIVRLTTEVARLREALERIACPSQMRNLLWWQEEARAALAALDGGK